MGTAALGYPAGQSRQFAGFGAQSAAISKPKIPTEGCTIKTVNLKSDMPEVPEALQRLDRELTLARQTKLTLLKLIHGYGSTGAGGDIRIAVQKRLVEMVQSGQIRGCIFGENWSKSDETTWRLLQSRGDLKNDPDLGRGNRGITIAII
ncbi:MAG: hypothetical protein WAM47_11710 [Candidatus Sulfotelmatobacter sp.]